MVKITFKNVGQGDSIILEWETEGQKHCGIIDCNLYQGTNPVLNHIIEKGYKEVSFAILSHPHADHYSGYLELLAYCESAGVFLRRFYHTALVTPNYLISASRGIEGKKEIIKLFQKLRELEKSDIITYVSAVDDNPDLTMPIGNDFNIQVLSPSIVESDKYINGVKYPFDEENKNSNPNANWLSTVLKIYNDSYAILLTSDAEKSTLTRIGKSKGGRMNRSKIIMGQARLTTAPNII